MQKLLSHPDKELKVHLGEVFNWGIFYKQGSNLKLSKEIDDEIIKSFFIFHDIGKATIFFQNYIRGQIVKEDLKSHAGISSMLFLYYHILNGNIYKNEEIIIRMAYVILKHHGDLAKLSSFYDYMYGKQSDLLILQYKSIEYSRLVPILSDLGLNLETLQQIFDGNTDKFIKTVSDYLNEKRRRLRKENLSLKKLKGNYGDKDLKYYFITQILFSMLVDADKSQVTLGEKNLAKRVDFQADVTKYIKDRVGVKTKLNELREMAYQEVNTDIDIDSNIFTLTLPTGMGKTLNAFNYAIQLRHKLFETYNIRYRIIYVMPFMSIIDQNADVIEKVLKEKNCAISSNILCKHHHLTEIIWKTDEDILIEPKNAQILIEGWNSEIIITTFQQFFSTLAGYKNSMQRKFNKLSHSIVIIDEIQAIPVKYHEFIGKLLTEFTVQMSSKVIAMTATQPKIFEKGIEKPLCDYKKYYEKLSRTIIINELDNSKTVEGFVESLTLKKEKRYLFILNTIESSKKLYFLLKDKFPEFRITYLSTLLPPVERLKRIAAIKEKKYDIVVSTQLVEAGVDIDFEVVYRDFAPMPSIFQSAGRGNREGKEGQKAEIHLIKLKNDRGIYYADQVYNDAKIDLNITAKIFKNYERLEEPEFMSVIEEYFETMADEEVKSQHLSKALINGAFSQWFYEREVCDLSKDELPLNCFELIEDKGEKFTVFIELDEKAKNLWKEYINILHKMEDKWEHKMNLKIIARKMSEYMVDIRVTTMDKYNKPPLGENDIYYYVSRSELNKFYNVETGYGIESNCYYY